SRGQTPLHPAARHSLELPATSSMNPPKFFRLSPRASPDSPSLLSSEARFRGSPDRRPRSQSLRNLPSRIGLLPTSVRLLRSSHLLLISCYCVLSADARPDGLVYPEEVFPELTPLLRSALEKSP